MKYVVSLSSRLFLRRRVTRLGLGIHGIETRQHRAGVHLFDDPGFHPFLFGAFGEYEIKKRLWNHHRTILVGDDYVIREDRHAAATDRFTPADEGQACDRWRSGIPIAPHW